MRPARGELRDEELVGRGERTHTEREPKTMGMMGADHLLCPYFELLISSSIIELSSTVQMAAAFNFKVYF